MKKRIVSRNMIESIVSSIIEHETSEWPPNCPFLTYQPVRPQRRLNQKRCEDHEKICVKENTEA